MKRSVSFQLRRSLRLLCLLAVTVLLIPGLLSGEEPKRPSFEVTATLRVHGNSSPPFTSEVTGKAEWFGTEKVEPVNFQIQAGKPATFKLQPGKWTLGVDAPGYWSAPYQLELGEKPASVTLDVWAAGALEGGFTSDVKVKNPSDLTVFFRSVPGTDGPQAPPVSRSACRIEGEFWRCKVPAGNLDLRFQAIGFVPRFLWGIRVDPGGTVRPGRLDLRPGSAVQGWVVTADGAPIGDQTKATLRPRIAGSVRDPVERKRLESLHFEAAINRRGFFQIEGVPPGAYLLEVRHQRYAPAVASVKVEPGTVTEIANPPLKLDLPKVVEIFIDPPLDPVGQPWTVKLQKLDRDSSIVDTVATESAGSDGSWKRAGISPGNYFIRISRQGGETWWDGSLVVDENPSPVYVSMNVVTVKGMVRYGEELLSAKIQFGGRWGATRIEAQSDNKGRFEILLPKTGYWSVFVSSDKPAVAREIPKLKIEPKPGTKTAEVEIHLPRTALRGRVVDEKDSPVPDAIVSAMSNGKVVEDRVQTRTDEEGKFEIRGLLAGPTLVEADAGDLAADPISVDVEKEEDSKSWILVARPRLRISGTVTSAAGPVAGARVTAAPAGIPYLGARSFTSDAQGHFQVTLPRAAREMLLSVGAPGFAYRMLRLPVPENRTLGVNLDQTGGTLRVENEGGIDYTDPNAPMVGILHGGSVEGLAMLTSWAVASGVVPKSTERTVVPNMEPGPYQACLIYPSEWVGLDFGIIPHDRCANGTLLPNGELVLKVPSR